MRFVGSENYLTSTSDTVTVEIDAFDTLLRVSPTSQQITVGGSATLSTHTTVVDGGDMPAWGTVQAALDGTALGEAMEVNVETGVAELTVPGLPVGTHDGVVTFTPHTESIAPAERTVQVEVVAAPAPAPSTPADAPSEGPGTPATPETPTSGDLAATGSSPDSTAAFAAGARGLLLAGGVLLLVRRRRAS